MSEALKEFMRKRRRVENSSSDSSDDENFEEYVPLKQKRKVFQAHCIEIF